jgi:phospholipid/cholesterol/gamma-HCH transport system permease protein
VTGTRTGRLSNTFGWTGRRTLSLGGYLLDLTTFIIDALSDWFGSRRLFNRATRQSLTSQIIFTGVDALPVITLLALAIGFSITSQLLTLAQALGSERDAGSLLINIVGVELASLLTAIVLIGRSGSAIAVDTGYMKLHGEVEAFANSSSPPASSAPRSHKQRWRSTSLPSRYSAAYTSTVCCSI